MVVAVVQAIKRGGSATIHIDGHADFDAQGDDFTMQKSVERAYAAQQTLMAQIMMRSDLEGIPRAKLAQQLQVGLTGWGTKKALYPANRPMSDREKNRRFEIEWQAAAAVRPPPRPGPEIPQLTLKLVDFGILSGDQRLTMVGEQTIRFVVTNNNVLPASFEIVNETGGSSERKIVSLLPTQTKEVEFSNFGGYGPKEWSFNVTQNSQSLIVSWSALSWSP